MEQPQEIKEQGKVTKSQSKKPLRVFSTVSGKGGVGKTSLAVNMGILAARRGHKVLILDADLGLANVEILLGAHPKYHLGHLIESDMEIDDVMTTGPSGLQVLSAGSGLQRLTSLDDDQKLRLINALDGISDRFDTVIVDSGAGIGDNVLFFVGASQEAILLVSPEPTSLMDAYVVLKVLSETVGTKYFHVIVNPIGNEFAARDVFDRLVKVSSRFLNATVRFAGFIPRDENVHRATMLSKPLVEVFPFSPSSRSMERIVDRLLATEAPSRIDGGMKFLWGRLLDEAQGALSET